MANLAGWSWRGLAGWSWPAELLYSRLALRGLPSISDGFLPDSPGDLPGKAWSMAIANPENLDFERRGTSDSLPVEEPLGLENPGSPRILQEKPYKAPPRPDGHLPTKLWNVLGFLHRKC